MDSQNQAILKYLKRGWSLTPIEALKRFGSFRLGARIYDLRKAGHAIDRNWAFSPTGKRFAKYRLAK